MGELHIITDGSLLIRDGVIVEVGPTRRVENLSEARNAIEINAAGRVVMPGFVDSHTHVAFPSPGIPDADRESALRHLNGCSGNLLRSRVLSSLEAMVRHGTSTAAVQTGAIPDLGAETKLLRVLAALRAKPLDLETIFLCAHSGDQLEGSDILERVRRRGVSFVTYNWDGRAANADLCDRFVAAARALGFICKLHASGGDPAAAIQTAVHHNLLSIDHLEHAAAADVPPLASSNVIATLLPAASYRNGGPHAPARALIDAGGIVALATDFSPHHASTLSMQTVISLACAHLRMSAAEAITAATFNAAYSLGRADVCGSLEPGKRADLVMLNTGDHRELAHHLGTNLVHFTMRDGAFIYREGKVHSPAAEDAA